MPVWPVLPTKDLGRAKNFYENILGLKLVSVNEAMGCQIYETGGTKIQVYKTGANHGENTAATFHVTNIDSEVEYLKEKGVVFEEYNMPGFKTQNGIATLETEKSAWFKDPDGNILCLHQTT